MDEMELIKAAHKNLVPYSAVTAARLRGFTGFSGRANERDSGP